MGIEARGVLRAMESNGAEHMVRTRTLVFNRVLLLMVGAATAGGVSALFEVLEAAGDVI